MLQQKVTLGGDYQGIDCIFISQWVHCEYDEWQTKPAGVLRFNLTNLEFTGQDYVQVDGIRAEALPLTIAGRKLTIVKRGEYKDTIEELKATKRCNVTAFLELALDGVTVEDSIELVRNVCLLFSLASGTQVQWISYELIDDKGQALKLVHRNAITSNYSGFLLIDNRNSTDLKSYIESTFDRFQALQPQYPMANIVNTIVDTKLGGSFIELRAMILGSITDILVGHWAQVSGSLYIVDPERFKEGFSQFKKEVLEKAIEIYGVTQKSAEEIANHAIGMYRHSFRHKLKKMIESLGAKISSREIDNFIETRNKLIHEGVFLTNEPVNEFQSIVYFVDRLVLALLGYRGPYLDCRTWQRVG